MTIYMVLNRDKPAAMDVAAEAARILYETGMNILVDETLPPLATDVPIRALPASLAETECDMILCVGGDGTILHTARCAMLNQKPLLGVNVGRLGFLAILEKTELQELRRLSSGDYTVEQRHVLRGDLGDEDTLPQFALNDIVLLSEKRTRTLSFEIYCDKILVNRFLGDGIIFSTPTGSTAYSMSAGGPILDTRLGGIVISQICPHVGKTPPIVISDERVVHIVVNEARGERAMLVCDGVEGQVLGYDDILRISMSGHTVQMIQFRPVQQLESINKKLMGR